MKLQTPELLAVLFGMVEKVTERVVVSFSEFLQCFLRGFVWGLHVSAQGLRVRARRWIFGVGVGLEFRVRVSGLGVRVTVKGSAQVAGRRVPVWELLSLCSRSIGDF